VRRVVLLAAAVAAVDQLTKWLILQTVLPDRPVAVVSGFFRLVNWGNTGAAWGIFQDSNLVLAAASLLTILALDFFRHSLHLQRGGAQIAFGLILGGIVGNVVDRLRLGYVVDFLDFYFGSHHWPAFNVADSGICIGVALYIIVSWRADKQASAAAS
jgi:signal peptidase II